MKNTTYTSFLLTHIKSDGNGVWPVTLLLFIFWITLFIFWHFASSALFTTHHLVSVGKKVIMRDWFCGDAPTCTKTWNRLSTPQISWHAWPETSGSLLSTRRFKKLPVFWSGILKELINFNWGYKNPFHFMSGNCCVVSNVSGNVILLVLGMVYWRAVLKYTKLLPLVTQQMDD